MDEELWVSMALMQAHICFLISRYSRRRMQVEIQLDFQIVNNLLLFKANTDSSGDELWITNGTENGTFMLNDVYPGTTSGIISYSTATDELNKLFFTGFDGNQRMLWETDGTVAGTIPLYDISESDLPIVY